jgi:hypothetical protein
MNALCLQPLRLINNEVILDETQHQATVALTAFQASA